MEDGKLGRRGGRRPAGGWMGKSENRRGWDTGGVKKEEGGRTLYSPGSNILSITNGSNGVIVMDISK